LTNHFTQLPSIFLFCLFNDAVSIDTV
jgi:hypothetical protein